MIYEVAADKSPTINATMTVIIVVSSAIGIVVSLNFTSDFRVVSQSIWLMHPFDDSEIVLSETKVSDPLLGFFI